MSNSIKELLKGKGLLAELEDCRNEEEAIKVLKRENLWGIINYPELEELKESYKNGEIEADGRLSLSQLDKVAGGIKGKAVRVPNIKRNKQLYYLNLEILEDKIVKNISEPYTGNAMDNLDLATNPTAEQAERLLEEFESKKYADDSNVGSGTQEKQQIDVRKSDMEPVVEDGNSSKSPVHEEGSEQNEEPVEQAEEKNPVNEEAKEEPYVEEENHEEPVEQGAEDGSKQNEEPVEKEERPYEEAEGMQEPVEEEPAPVVVEPAEAAEEEEASVKEPHVEQEPEEPVENDNEENIAENENHAGILANNTEAGERVEENPVDIKESLIDDGFDETEKFKNLFSADEKQQVELFATELKNIGGIFNDLTFKEQWALYFIHEYNKDCFDNIVYIFKNCSLNAIANIRHSIYDPLYCIENIEGAKEAILDFVKWNSNFFKDFKLPAPDCRRIVSGFQEIENIMSKIRLSISNDYRIYEILKPFFEVPRGSSETYKNFVVEVFKNIDKIIITTDPRLENQIRDKILIIHDFEYDAMGILLDFCKDNAELNETMNRFLKNYMEEKVLFPNDEVRDSFLAKLLSLRTDILVNFLNALKCANGITIENFLSQGRYNATFVEKITDKYFKVKFGEKLKKAIYSLKLPGIFDLYLSRTEIIFPLQKTMLKEVKEVVSSSEFSSVTYCDGKLFLPNQYSGVDIYSCFRKYMDDNSRECIANLMIGKILRKIGIAEGELKCCVFRIWHLLSLEARELSVISALKEDKLIKAKEIYINSEELSKEQCTDAVFLELIGSENYPFIVKDLLLKKTCGKKIWELRRIFSSEDVSFACKKECQLNDMRKFFEVYRTGGMNVAFYDGNSTICNFNSETLLLPNGCEANIALKSYNCVNKDKLSGLYELKINENGEIEYVNMDAKTIADDKGQFELFMLTILKTSPAMYRTGEVQECTRALFDTIYQNPLKNIFCEGLMSLHHLAFSEKLNMFGTGCYKALSHSIRCYPRKITGLIKRIESAIDILIHEIGHWIHSNAYCEYASFMCNNELYKKVSGAIFKHLLPEGELKKEFTDAVKEVIPNCSNIADALINLYYLNENIYLQQLAEQIPRGMAVAHTEDDCNLSEPIAIAFEALMFAPKLLYQMCVHMPELIYYVGVEVLKVNLDTMEATVEEIFSKDQNVDDDMKNKAMQGLLAVKTEFKTWIQ